jgi:hypothetical protein
MKRSQLSFAAFALGAVMAGCGGSPPPDARAGVPQSSAQPSSATTAPPPTTTHVALRYVTFEMGWVQKFVPGDTNEARTWAARPENARIAKPKTAHILVKTGDDTSPAGIAKAEKKANALLARIKKGEDFGKVAEESDDPGSNRRRGEYPGEMVEQFVKPYQDAYNALAPGEMTKSLVRTSFGFHIIKKLVWTDADALAAYRRVNGVALARKLADDLVARIEKKTPFDRALDEAFTATLGQTAIADTARPHVLDLDPTIVNRPTHTPLVCDELRRLGEGGTRIVTSYDGTLLVGAKLRVQGEPPAPKLERSDPKHDVCTHKAYETGPRGELTPEQAQQLMERIQMQQGD